MLDKLSGEARSKVEPFLNRFDTFAQKITSRVQEIEAEADAGLSELIQGSPLDTGALSAGFSAVKSRIQQLGDKVQSAEEKLEEEWEESTGDLDLEGEEQSAMYQLWFGLVNRSRDLQHKLEQWAEKIEVKKNADWARVLYKMAEQECTKPRSCPSCGASIEVSIQHAHSAVRCPHCDSVNELDIGQATGLYYQGNGVHSLAQETSFELWVAQHEAEKAYNAWRHPTDDDRKAYLDAVTNYWTAYYQATQKLHPGFKQTIEEAVGARLAHYHQYDPGKDQSDRAYYGQLVRLAKARDSAALKAHMQNAEDLEECASAIHEHGDRDGAVLALQIQYQLEDEDEDQQEWIQEKLNELDENLANR
jgi:hypothetical protein